MFPWLPRRHADAGSAQREEQQATIDLLGQVDGPSSAQEICDVVADGLEINAIVVERMPSGFVVVAGSPWQPTLQALDRLALDACFRDVGPTGNGSDFSAGSDWLFVPISSEGCVVAALGLAGRYFRRRFNPLDEVVGATIGALQPLYQGTGARSAE